MIWRRTTGRRYRPTPGKGGEGGREILKVEVSASSVNGGIPFPASGAVANSRNAIAGYLTTGTGTVFLTRALKV